jgi:anti-anti-sigma factor
MLSTESPPILFNTTFCKDILLIQMPPRLTVLEASIFRQFFQEKMQQVPPFKKVILDFGPTVLIDSSGIGALLSNLKSSRAHHIPLTLWSVGAQVKLAFSLAGLEEVLTLESHTESTQVLATHPPKSHSSSTHVSVRSPCKRLIDILGSLVGLGMMGTVFVPIAIAIKLDSPGPILFSQIRCGLMGRRFRIWKFRTMVVNAEALKETVPNQRQGAFFKNESDPRVTRIGRFLRKTSLDEMPQFWNVLIGEMSLVGTRPPTIDEIEQYEISNWQRLDVKPGMSGEWQVKSQSKIYTFEEVVQLDLQYQEHWSLRYDIKLILKTLLVLFRKNSTAA